MYQLIDFGWVLNEFWTSFSAPNAPAFIYLQQGDKQNLPKENAVKMMGPYDPADTLARLIEQLEKGR